MILSLSMVQVRLEYFIEIYGRIMETIYRSSIRELTRLTRLRFGMGNCHTVRV
jgi:hypothetical protein